ncbi:hypothetical protein B0H10DRAFT_1940385 [Mycena sp. CBHHK59/15]|nr:hypothetical protein B0H10DRAFT_1940385 [Mycena sp. CBHHK59/15]
MSDSAFVNVMHTSHIASSLCRRRRSSITHENGRDCGKIEKPEWPVKAAADTVEQKRKSRAKIHAKKIAASWVPAHTGRKQKIIELEDVDQGPSASSAKLAEDSRLHHQFKEDSKKKNKPQGRKQKPENVHTNSKQANRSSS